MIELKSPCLHDAVNNQHYVSLKTKNVFHSTLPNKPPCQFMPCEKVGQHNPLAQTQSGRSEEYVINSLVLIM